MSKVTNKQPASFFIEGILKRDIAILSRAITLVESRQKEHHELSRNIIEGIISKTGNSFRLGITGVPGVGKSTFIESFGKFATSHGHRLAVLAIDPSSTKSRGSILGDKTRMETLSVSENVFIRPSPSSGSLGGVARSTYETILLCEAAGYDFIIIETVGVGQSETAVSRITDFFLLLMLAGAGDELQGIKRGIMEMADALVITKADSGNLDKAKTARTEYAHAMHMLQLPDSGWRPKVLTCSALENKGIKAIFEMLEEYQRHVRTNGYFEERRKEQRFEILKDALDQEILQKYYSENDLQQRLEDLRKQPLLNPFAEVSRLLGGTKPL